MGGYIIILKMKTSVLDKMIENINIQMFLQQTKCLENMTGYIIILQMKAAVLDKTIEILTFKCFYNKQGA